MPPFALSAARTAIAAISTCAMLCIVPAEAAPREGRTAFARRVANTMDFPATAGHFQQKRQAQHAGPADLDTATPSNRQRWRMCRECSYDGDATPRFKTIDLRASFQPIGGTIRYRF